MATSSLVYRGQLLMSGIEPFKIVHETHDGPPLLGQLGGFTDRVLLKSYVARAPISEDRSVRARSITYLDGALSSSDPFGSSLESSRIGTLEYPL